MRGGCKAVSTLSHWNNQSSTFLFLNRFSRRAFLSPFFQLVSEKLMKIVLSAVKLLNALFVESF